MEQRKHICENYQFQRNSFRRNLGSVGTEMCSALLDPCPCSGFPPFPVNGRGGLPCPFESAGAIDFDFGQWFVRIIFSCDFLDSFDAMFEDLILTSNISSIISPILFQIFLH